MYLSTFVLEMKPNVETAWIDYSKFCVPFFCYNYYDSYTFCRVKLTRIIFGENIPSEALKRSFLHSFNRDCLEEQYITALH